MKLFIKTPKAAAVSKVAAFSLTAVLLAPVSARADAVTSLECKMPRKAALAACHHRRRRTGSHESRMYAMMHVAIHDALNAIDRRSRPYVFDAQVDAGASPRGRRRSGRARCAGPGHRSTPGIAGSAVAGRHRQRRSRLCRGARGNSRRSPPRRRAFGRTGRRRRHSCACGLGWFGSRRWGISTTRRAPNPGEFRFTPGFNFASRRDGAMSLRLCSTTARSFVPVLRTK